MDCLQVNPGKKVFMDYFNAKSAQLRIPLSGSMALTHHCNLRCVHCYIDKDSKQLSRNEMGTKKILSIIDEIADAGCLHLLFTGGEPFLRNDFPEIYCYAKKKGMIVTVFTNATLINPEVIGLFNDLKPYTIEISLYGATAETYEKVTGVKGSYEKCLNGIQSLLENKINTRLKTILMTINSHEFYEIENIAKHFGLKFRFDAAIFPRTNGDRTPLELRVPAYDAVEKEFSDPERVLLWERYSKKYTKQTLSEKLYHCGAGITNFHIDPYGNLQPCLITTSLQTSLLNSSFMSGWTGIISGISDKKAGNNFRCSQCDKIHLCGFCPSFFEMENQAGDQRSEYICSMGYHRFKLINKIISEVSCG